MQRGRACCKVSAGGRHLSVCPGPRPEGLGLSVVHVVSCFVFGSRGLFHIFSHETLSWKRAPYILIFQPSTVCTLIVLWTCAAASLHWRKHVYQHVSLLPILSSSCLCFATPKKVPDPGPRNGVAIQKLEAQLLNSWPPFSPLNWRPSSMAFCAWLPRCRFHSILFPMPSGNLT